MSTPAFVRQVQGVVGAGAKLYRDDIMDAGFIFHTDFKSDYVRNGIAEGAGLAGGQLLKNLIVAGNDASVTTPFSYGFESKGLRSVSGAGFLKLPDNMKLATTETHFAFCIWAGVDLSIGALPNNGVISFGGWAYQVGTYMQYALGMNTNASGDISTLRGYADGRAVEFGASALAAIADGNLHQMIVEFEVINSGTQKRITLYFDGLQVAQEITTYDGNLNQPSDSISALGPAVGPLGGFTAGFKGHYGRCWMKRFIFDADNISIASIAAREWTKYGSNQRFN